MARFEIVTSKHSQRVSKKCDLVGKNEHHDQEAAQALMFVFVFLMMLGLFKNIVCRVLSVFAFTFYTCFMYNLALYHDSESIYYFCLNLLIATFACDDLVTAYLEGQDENKRRHLKRQQQAKEV